MSRHGRGSPSPVGRVLGHAYPLVAVAAFAVAWHRHRWPVGADALARRAGTASPSVHDADRDGVTAVLAVAVVIVLVLFAVAAVIDVRDRRRHHRARSWAVIDAERHDLHADLASTQHRGIAIPIGDICRDRQRHR